MLVVEIFLIAVVVFGVAAVAMGFGGSMTQFAPDWPGRPLPQERTLHADDVEAARFSLAFRGYRMSEVDDALATLAKEIADRDERIRELTGHPYERPPAVADTADPAPDLEPVQFRSEPSEPSGPSEVDGAPDPSDPSGPDRDG